MGSSRSSTCSAAAAAAATATLATGHIAVVVIQRDAARWRAFAAPRKAVTRLIMICTLFLWYPNKRAAILLRPILDQLKPRWFLTVIGVPRSVQGPPGADTEKPLVSLELLHGGFKVVNMDDEDVTAGRILSRLPTLLFEFNSGTRMPPDN